MKHAIFSFFNNLIITKTKKKTKKQSHYYFLNFFVDPSLNVLASSNYHSYDCLKSWFNMYMVSIAFDFNKKRKKKRKSMYTWIDSTQKKDYFKTLEKVLYPTEPLIWWLPACLTGLTLNPIKPWNKDNSL